MIPWRTDIENPQPERAPDSPWARKAWATAVLFSLLAVAGPVCAVVLMGTAQDKSLGKMESIITLALTPLQFAALVGLALPVLAFCAWREGWWGRPRRLVFSFLSGGVLLMIPFLKYWNLLGYQF